MDIYSHCCVNLYFEPHFSLQMQNWFDAAKQQGSSNWAHFHVKWCTRKPEADQCGMSSHQGSLGPSPFRRSPPKAQRLLHKPGWNSYGKIAPQPFAALGTASPIFHRQGSHPLTVSCGWWGEERVLCLWYLFIQQNIWIATYLKPALHNFAVL